MRRILSCLLSVSIALAALVAPALAATAAPGSALTITKEAPATVLAGGDISYILTASNTNDPVPQYNVSFSDVLPAGVTYVPGSTLPAMAGEPTVINNKPTAGQTTLVWRDVFDLQPGDSNALTFSARPDLTSGQVGNTVKNTGQAYSNAAPRTVPTFDANGKIVAGSFSESATSNDVTTKISALDIEKSEPSPENELLRGLHTQSTVYTVKVTNNKVATTNGVIVTDYLPANLEFLGCGGVDNTTGQTPEYPGAPNLTGTPVIPAMNLGSAAPEGCLPPASVDTVTNPAGYPAGVYTKVVWNLGTLTTGKVATLKYAAGVPLHENVAFTTPPSAASGKQAANLDNNTGRLTRQVGNGAAATNYVVASGNYTGAVQGPADRDAQVSAKHTVTIHDVRILKSVDQSKFIPGQIATYKLTLQAGEYAEYANGNGLTITDTLPNGMCPLGSVNYKSGTPAECDPAPGKVPSVAYDSVNENLDGTFTIVFKPNVAIAANGEATLTYPVRMRLHYEDASPTSAGDAFVNNVEQTGSTTPIANNTADSGAKSVTDPSSATLGTGVETLSKEIGKRANPADCSTAVYGDNATLTPESTTFVRGDKVCFRISVNFDTSTDTRNPVITDFLPANLAYDAGSAAATIGNIGIPADQIAFTNNSGALTWRLGAANGGGTYSAVGIGAVFQVVFSATVTKTAAGAAASDKAGNLAKFRATNTAGKARSLRDGVDFTVQAAPISLSKGVAEVNGVVNPGGKDATVKEGDVVTYQVGVRNNSGTAPLTLGQDITNPEVWDVLPAPLTCATVSAISDGGVCTNPGAGTHPSFGGNATHSAIRWETAGLTILPGATHNLSYKVTVPAAVGAGESLLNTAAVRSYRAQTNAGGTVEHFPGANIDTSVPLDQQDPQPATDTATIKLPGVTLSKGVTSAVNETNNIGAEVAPMPSTKATIGELVTYTVVAKIPAGTTVFNGALTDPMPAGLALVSATASFAPNATTPVYSGTLPSGVTFNAGTPAINFGAGSNYDNTTATDQLFKMVITARVTTAVGNAIGVARVNTAKFASDAAAAGRTDPADVVATATTGVVEPAPLFTKSNNAPATVSGGQLVTFTLTATNAVGRTPLHDVWVVDCLPAGLTFDSYGTPSQGTTASAQKPAPGPGGNGVSCPANTTQLAWNVNDAQGVLAPGAMATLSYTARVDNDAAGSLTYTNNASLTGNSLAGARPTPATPGNTDGRTYTSATSSSIKVAGATTTKIVDKPTAAVGDTVTYTVTTTLPAHVNFFNAAVVDTLPAGINAASVALVPGSVSCLNADSSGCAINSATQLAANGATLAFLLGDVAADASARTVTLKYTATVDAATAENAAGKTLTNAAKAAWDVTDKTPPTDSGYTFEQTGTDSTVNVTVLEPKVTIAKSVDQPAPELNSTFNYSLTVSNWTNVNASAAHNIVVRDVVPVNVKVNAASIVNGGTLTGNDPVTGGGTITWTLTGPLAPGASLTLGYSATLAPSAQLTATGLVNTATVTGYESLPAGGRHYNGNSSTATVTPKFPALTAAKTTPNGTLAYIGKSFDWQVTVSNGAAAGVAYEAGAVDTLPAGWTYDIGSARVTVNAGTPTAIEPTVAGQELTWNNLGTLPAGAKLVISYTATPGNSVLTSPGVGMSIKHTNTVLPTGKDATGELGNKTGPYTGPEASAQAEIASADLLLSKAVGKVPEKGGTGTWTLTVKNNGPDTARGLFTVTDTVPVPAGFTLTSMSGAGWACTLAAVSCTRNDTLNSGASFEVITLGYSVAQNVAEGTSYPNTATVTGGTYDPVPGNNTSTATATVIARADLGLSKTLTTPMVAGSRASYALTVTNHGPSDSVAGMYVTDTLPAGTTFVSADGGADWNCPIPVGGVLTCTYGKAMTLGAVAPQIVVTIGVPSSMTAAVVNTAVVTGITPDPDTTNNTSTVTTTPTEIADMRIVKTRTNPLVAGAIGDYTIVVTNFGPSDARSVVVTDTLDPHLSFDSYVGADWNCSATGQDVVCSYKGGGAFPAQAASTLTLKVRVAQSLTQPVANTATVTSTTPDPVPGNNTSTSPGTNITGVTDLSITKTHAPGNAVAGENLDYALTVHNAGPSTVSGKVTVRDTLPEGMSYVGFSGTGWTCTNNAQVVTCLGADGLVTGNDSTVTITVLVAQNAGPGILVNTATVEAPALTPDTNPTNNSATDPTTVVRQSSISLAKSLNTPTPVVAGTNATFTLAVTNNGPSDATAVIVTDTLPQYMEYVSAVGTGWVCDNLGQIVTCERNTAVSGPAGTVPSIVVTALIDPGTPFTPATGTTVLQNTAVVTTGSPSTITNPPAVDVPVIARADLVLTKTGATPTAIAGTQFVWTINVNNAGPSNAAGPLTVRDTLPPYQRFASASGTAWACVADPAPANPAIGQDIVCTTSGLVTGGSTDPLVVTVDIDAAAPANPAVSNTATVSAPTIDPVPGNNAGTATVAVEREQNLKIAKSHTGNAVIGSTLDFQLTVSNESPSTATLVHVEDALPAGLSYVAAQGPGWTCTPGTGTIACDYAGPLQPKATAPAITVTALVGVAAYPSVVNTATVSSLDPALPGSSTDDDKVLVDPAAVLRISKTHTGSFTAGAPGTYTLQVSNEGLTETPGPVVVTDTLPNSLRFKAASGDGWLCAATAQDVTCTHNGALAVGVAKPITLTVDVLPAAFPAVENTATVTGTGSDPATSTDKAIVGPQISWSIDKKLTGYKDGKAGYSITVSNTGANPTVSDNVVVDELPNGLVFDSFTGAGWACLAASNVVSCTYAGVIGAGESRTVELSTVVTAAPGTTLSNVASVSGGGAFGSTDPSNPTPGTTPNAGSTSADLTVTKNGQLSNTGAATAPLLALALLLLLTGGGALFLRRRRDSRA